MKVETVLPRGKLDPGLRETVEPLDIDGYFEGAKRVVRIEIASAVAIAFPRSPTVTAQAAWTLQKLSHGRLSPGLGTQVKGHVERRYSMKWVPPGPWLRAYTQAVRAVWHADHTGKQPAHEGEHYSISLMVSLFDPGPLDKPDIPIAIAGVKTCMSRLRRHTGLPSTITAIPTLRLNSRNCLKRSAGTRCQSRQRRGR